MLRISCATLAFASLLMAGCGDNAPAAPAEPAAPAAAPAPAAEATPKSELVPLETAQAAAASASLVAGEGAAKILTTDPANGSYSMTLALPKKDGPAIVRLRLQVESGGIGAVVTDAYDSNKWLTDEAYATAGTESVIELKVPSLAAPQALLVRNYNAAAVASKAIIKSVEIETAG